MGSLDSTRPIAHIGCTYLGCVGAAAGHDDRQDGVVERDCEVFSHCRGPAFDLGEPSLRFLGFQYQLPNKNTICTAMRYIYIYDFCTLYIHIKFRRIYTTLVTSQGRLPLGHHIFKDQEVFPPVLKLLTLSGLCTDFLFNEKNYHLRLEEYMENMIDSFPKPSMVAWYIYLHEWLIFYGFHVGKYTIHGSNGFGKQR